MTYNHYSIFRGALRRFLPQLRLLTLTLEEAAVLPPTLVNQDEKMALIETIVARDAANKPLLPTSLNASNASRVLSYSMKVMLIPDTSPLEPLEKPAKLYSERFSNTLWLIPKLDVCLTAIEILMENGKSASSYLPERASNLTLKLVDKSTKTFIPFQFPTNSAERSFVFQSTKLTQWILKKDKQVFIKVVYKNDSSYSNITFEKVPSDVVQNQLKKSSQLPGFRKIYFASSSGAPAFVKSISYAIPSSVNAIGGENLTATMRNDTSSEDEVDEEDDEDDYNSSF
jgi:hypothetical protein